MATLLDSTVLEDEFWKMNSVEATFPSVRRISKVAYILRYGPSAVPETSLVKEKL